MSVGPQRTSDGRHVVVDGRRWRATDPSIPDPLRTELVSELMAARRSVRAASGDSVALKQARRRVHDAKVALGERGEPWWQPRSEAGLDARVRAAANALLAKRGRSSSICPSDVARIVASPDWRSAMDSVRATVGQMAREGRLVITSGDDEVHDIDGPEGPIRLRLPKPSFSEDSD